MLVKMTPFFLLVFMFSLPSLDAAVSPSDPQKSIPKMEFDSNSFEGRLLRLFQKASGDDQMNRIKKVALEHGGESVSALLRVMKDSRFPDNSRWTATFLLAQITGEKSGPVLKKFLTHPNWMMRLASLKALLALGVEDYGDQYAELLEDASLLVRAQALENIRHLNLVDYAPNVWAMLYDRENYHEVEGHYRRGDIIRTVILTIGDLDFGKAKDPLLKMVQQDRYNDIFTEVDYTLQRITGRKSPESPEKSIKRRFWQRVAMSYANL